MYCWGDDMTDWAAPDAYAFKGTAAAKAARAEAAKESKAKGGRTYEKRSAPLLDLTTPRKTLRTKSTNPIVVAVDVTGSMQRWPFEIFDRLPLLYQTLSQYREDVEVSFVALGDATSDRFPLQVTDFRRGLPLEETLGALYGEGGGGGGARESYELLAYQLLYRCQAPEATRPFLILYGDEGFYPTLEPALAKAMWGDVIDEPLDSRRLWQGVAEAWNVFHLRKPYGGHQEASIHAQWAEALGEERIVLLDDVQRAVDVALGIVARQWGHFGDFEQNLAARQAPDVVARVADRVERVVLR